MKIDLIEEWRDAWRYWSVKLNAIGLAIMAWVWFDPTALLYVLNLAPPALRHYVPDRIEALIGFAVFALAIISRLVKQRKVGGRNG
ncbi:hypothetical protein [Altericroceibacterium endophyticum]|uniref:Uncharacterized protein n=1 Tax=Altericroceibacterium endophyticum TaxID=1808508 RepID=A0A6I4T5X0_9SPHN|nr:hypothetical protein [Altericroceibacterium endophyticum]MXO66247.1 hypothetical protein [Altericroceibacterium endophyticum]